MDVDGSNYHITLNLSEEESNKGTGDPWECGVDGAYHGTGKYINGTLSEVNNYAPIFKDRVIENASGNNTTISAEENETIFKNTINQFIANDILDD